MTNKSSLGHVERIIREAAEDFFEDSDEHMRVTLRVTVEFSEFLLKYSTEPVPSEVSYMVGTVQSAVDSFFLIGQISRVFRELEESWARQPALPSSFIEIRTAFLRHFDVLKYPNSTAVQA